MLARTVGTRRRQRCVRARPLRDARVKHGHDVAQAGRKTPFAQKNTPVGGPTGVLCGADCGSDERIEGVNHRGEIEVDRRQPHDARDPDRIDI